MRHYIKTLTIIYTVIVGFFATPTIAWEIYPDHIYPLTIVHPGKLDLIYTGFNNDKSMLFVNANGKEFHIFKDVQEPSIQSIFLLENTVINQGDTVLDIGTGSGIQAIFAAAKAQRVVATDISDASIKNALYNVKLHKLDKKIEVLKSDLFKSLKPGEQFNVILINIGYPYDNDSLHLWKLHERFFSEVNAYLAPYGRIYYEIGFLQNIPHVQSMAARNGFRILRLHMEDAFLHQRIPIVFELRRLSERAY